MSTDLANYFRAQAEWRDAKAEEYPEDKRNAKSAVALRALAEYVEPIEHETAESPSGEHYLSFVLPVEAHLFEGMILGGERTRREVSRYGYGHPVTGSPEQFLGDLLLLCIKDAYEHAAEHGDDPTGALHPFEVDAAKDGIFMEPSYWRHRDRSAIAEREKRVHEARAAEHAGGDA